MVGKLRENECLPSRVSGDILRKFLEPAAPLERQTIKITEFVSPPSAYPTSYIPPEDHYIPWGFPNKACLSKAFFFFFFLSSGGWGKIKL